jgi:hypothetical protein
MNHPIDRHAFSTDNPETVAAYRQAIADRKAYEERVSSEFYAAYEAMQAAAEAATTGAAQ